MIPPAAGFLTASVFVWFFIITVAFDINIQSKNMFIIGIPAGLRVNDIIIPERYKFTVASFLMKQNLHTDTEKKRRQ